MATALFLVHGFDNVTVAEVAAAAEVSEQTVFNYFPTEESLFFDRSEPMIRTVADAVRQRRDIPLVEVATQTIAGEIHSGRWADLDDAGQLKLVRRFCEVATTSPTLAAARFADLQRFVDEVSVALADRAGRDPEDAEVDLATFVIAGLVAVRVQSAYRHAQLATSFAELNDLIHRDFLGRGGSPSRPLPPSTSWTPRSPADHDVPPGRSVRGTRQAPTTWRRTDVRLLLKKAASKAP